MNYAIVFRLLGYVMLIEGALLLLPAAASWIYGEWFVLGVFLITAAVSAAIGYALRGIKPQSKVFYMREGFAATSLSWIVISIVGAVPFVVTGCIPNPVDALFETVSGFTTTGASILPGVEDLPKGILFWRSFTHWIGGMGVLVFLLSLLPLTGGSHVNLMKAESPGPQVDKLVPKVQSTAKILYGIYFALTVLELVFLMLGGMPLFESMLTAFGTAGTGGFGIKNDSIAGYSPYLQNVCTVFMLLFGVNFNCYYLLLIGNLRSVLKDEEVRLYFGIVFGSIALIAWNIRHMYATIEETLRHAAFQVATIITTTGYATTDFDLWPSFSKAILMVLMAVGACAGSTGGGIKCARVLLLFKSLRRNIHKVLDPRKVQVVRINNRPVSEVVLENTNAYLAAYASILVFSFLVLSIDGFTTTTNFTAVLSCFNNIGPGLEAVGPTCNYASFSVLSKLVLIMDMLAGRLEIFPILVLFSRSTWRKK